MTYVIAMYDHQDNTNNIFFYEEAANEVDALLQFAQDAGVLGSMPEVHDMDADSAIEAILQVFEDWEYVVSIAEV